jgi:hypothetical protein
MPTNRTSITRKQGKRISVQALDIFRRMMELLEIECTCEKGTRVKCAGCEEYWELDWQLHQELNLAPWEGFPTFTMPGNKEDHLTDWNNKQGRKLYFKLCKMTGLEP